MDLAKPPGPEAAVLSTDVVDSTRLHSTVGDERATALWAEHNRIQTMGSRAGFPNARVYRYKQPYATVRAWPQD